MPLDLGSGVTLIFDKVKDPGLTDLTTSGTGPPPPAGFRVGTPPIYYDISTTATFNGTVEVCIDYDESAFVTEASLRLFHREGNAWTDVTTLLDTDINRICGSVSFFSFFLPAEQPFGVGGIAELPEVAGAPLETGGSSRANVGFAVAIATGAVALGGAAWVARRRLRR